MQNILLSCGHFAIQLHWFPPWFDWIQNSWTANRISLLQYRASIIASAGQLPKFTCQDQKHQYVTEWNIYRKSSIRSRPLIQVYSIRGRAIGGSVQALIIGKSLNPSKLPYLDLYELLQIKNFALEIVIFEIPLIQV